MAIVVIGTMLGFISGSYIHHISQRRSNLYETVAYFEDNKKITNYDLMTARRELEILRLMGADSLLRQLSMAQLPSLLDLHSLVLGELLFSQPTISPLVSRQIKQIAIANQYTVSDKQINDIYKLSVSADIYWLLLKKEAQQAGIAFSDDAIGRQLGMVIPKLFDGTTYSQMVNSMVNQRGISEEEILKAYGELIAVLEYARMLCSNEDVTAPQLMHMASWETEAVDVNFVRFDSAMFADEQPEPTRLALTEHFEKYKKYFAGELSEENPYGFGYKQPDRVELEYIAIMLGDVAETVLKPTQQETEEYYQKYIKQFIEEVPSDPNDPNSLVVEHTKSYTEVADEISRQMFQARVNSKAEKILQQAKTLTEAVLERSNVKPEDLNSEDFRRLAGDYVSATERLKKEYKIDLYVGRTGLLSATDIRSDQYLSRLYLVSPGYRPTELSKIVFAVDEIGSSKLGPFDVPKPRLYENIGPLRDVLGQMAHAELASQVMAIMRVVKAQKASEPQSIDQSFSKRSLRLGRSQANYANEIYSVADEVSKDMKKLAAMKTTKTKAEEFISSAVKDGWQAAIDKFSGRYSRSAAEKEGEPNALELVELTNQHRIPDTTVYTLAFQSQGEPMRQSLLNNLAKHRRRIDLFYSLVPDEKETVETLPLVVEFKPDMSYYCIKDISVKRLERSEYEKDKSELAWREDITRSQSLAVVHFNPENILKRMGFRPLKKEKRAAETNAPSQTEEVYE
jgi:hypothetical protein